MLSMIITLCWIICSGGEIRLSARKRQLLLLSLSSILHNFPSFGSSTYLLLILVIFMFKSLLSLLLLRPSSIFLLLSLFLSFECVMMSSVMFMLLHRRCCDQHKMKIIIIFCCSFISSKTSKTDKSNMLKVILSISGDLIAPPWKQNQWGAFFDIQDQDERYQMDKEDGKEDRDVEQFLQLATNFMDIEVGCCCWCAGRCWVNIFVIIVDNFAHWQRTKQDREQVEEDLVEVWDLNLGCGSGRWNREGLGWWKGRFSDLGG